MSTVNKLGNNRYLATSKNVNRMLNQLNGILAADNISVQNIPSTTTTISLASGNFINITMPAVANQTYTFTNTNPGIYYLLFTTNATVTNITLTNVKKQSGATFTGEANQINLITIICDGTNMYEVSRILNLK